MDWYKISQEKEPWEMEKIDYIGDWEYYYSDKVTDDEYREFIKKRRGWDDEMFRALSEGQVSEEEARERGLNIGNVEKPVDIPNVLYHVTTAKDKVVLNSLKTRTQLDMGSGTGLGGGASNTVSFTEDVNIAKNIYSAIIEGRQVARNEITTEEMIQQATSGETANEPWINGMIEYWKGAHGDIKDLLDKTVREKSYPKTIEELKEDEGEGWTPTKKWEFGTRDDMYSEWARPMTTEELLDRRFQFYKGWASFRESAGGPENPLFFGSDPQALANVQTDQIAILEFQANPGAKGYQLEALGEWRTWSGNAVTLVREIAP